MAKKGLNMEKVVEIRNEVEEVMEVETTPVVVTEMVEHVGASLEDIDALREIMIEEQMKEIERVEEMDTLREMRIKKQIEVMNELYVKELNEVMVELKNKVHNGIKYAIIKGKDVESDVKFVSGKQLLGIFKSYKEITGVEMSDMQKDYLKTLNHKQISNILYTLNVARKQFIIA